jgi:hypothetical protein
MVRVIIVHEWWWVIIRLSPFFDLFRAINFSSFFFAMTLKRTVMSLVVLEEMNLLDHTEVKRSWRINERHYGSL